MSISINIHPANGKWEKVEAEVYNVEHGACVNFDLDYNTFSFHYGSEENKKDFILKFKEAIDGLPEE